jgi:hypothetical protein
MRATPLVALDFPLICYGAAVFAASSDVPLFVMAGREAAESIAGRLNASEHTAQVVEAIADEMRGNMTDDVDPLELIARILRVIRGSATVEDFPAPEPIPAAPEQDDPGGWTLPERKSRASRAPNRPGVSPVSRSSARSSLGR